MTNSSTTLQTQDLKHIIQIYLGSHIASGVFLVVATLVTALGNGLLLLAIWKDPFKTFRTPNTFFVIGLAVADFLTGITVCPLTAFQDIGLYISVKRRDSSIIPSLQKAEHFAHLISAATMNSSYIILLLFYLESIYSDKLPLQAQSACYEESSYSKCDLNLGVHGIVCHFVGKQSGRNGLPKNGLVLPHDWKSFVTDRRVLLFIQSIQNPDEETAVLESQRLFGQRTRCS